MSASEIAAAIAGADEHWRGRGDDAPLSDLGQVACDLAANYGYRVHPCNGKVPLLPRWQVEASTSLDVVEANWRRHPDASVGIATGAESGVVVLDIDDRQAFDRWCAEAGIELPETPVAMTPRGGEHRYFAHPGGEIRNTTGWPPGCDIRGDHGNIIAPVGEGRGWAPGMSPLDIEPAPLPAALLRDRSQTAPAPPVADRVLEGSRNATLASLAGSMRRRGASEAAIMAALVEENRTRCHPPLPDDEIHTIAHSVAKYEPERTPPTINLMIEPFASMVARDIPPRRYLVAPWLRERSLSMIYAPKGTGKTNFIITLLVGLATGREVFGWCAHEPRRVLVVDGELDEEELRERIAAICRGLALTEREMLLVGENLFTLSRDRLAQSGILFGYLGDPELQAAFRAQLPPEIALVAWDNLSCLFGGEENDAAAWDGTLLFLLRLKHELGAASIFLHHSGKGGDQRGTSRREDNLDNSLRLEPVKKDGELTADGTHFRTVWAKHRGFKLSQAPSIVCELEVEPVGPPAPNGAPAPMRATWKVTKTDDVRLNVLVEEYGVHLREHGTPPTVRGLHDMMTVRATEDDQPELKVSRGTVQNLLERARALSLLEG